MPHAIDSMEREPASCDYLLARANYCADAEAQDTEGRIYLEPNEQFWAPKLQGTDFDQWCTELLREHLFPQWIPTMRGHFAGGEKTYYEISNSITQPLKLSMILPFKGIGIGARMPDGPTTELRKSVTAAVTNSFISSAAPISGVSLWFHDFDHMYAVWPTFALNNSRMRTLVSVLLPRVPSGAFDHMTTRYDRVKFPLFPVPGCQFIGIFDELGEPLQYNSRKHSLRLAHLAHNGGINRALPCAEDPNDGLQENWRKLFAAARLTDLTGCTKPNKPTELRPTEFGIEFNAAQARVVHALQAAQPPAPPPPEDLMNARLRFDTDDYYDPRAAVGQLKAIVASLADPLDNSPVFKRLNEWFLVEGFGGCATLYEKSLESKQFMRDPTRPHCYLTLVKGSIADVRRRFAGIKLSYLEGGKVQRGNPIDLWLEQECLNVVKEIVINMMPSSEVLVDPYSVPLQFNNWRGYDFYRKKHYTRMHALHADKSLTQLFELDSVRTILALVYGVLCNGDPIGFRAMLLFLANVLQLPNDPPRKCVVCRGAEGVGKSMLVMQLVLRIFGFAHSAVFSDPNMVIGNFTAPISGKAFAVMEEAFLVDDKNSAGRLQQAITGEWQMINEKFQPVKLEWNQLSMWLNSNKGKVVHMNRDARRFLVYDVNDIATKLTREQKTHFFSDLVSHIEGDGMYEFAYFLARVDLKDYLKNRAQFILHNQALALQKSKSLASAQPVHAWLDDRYYSGVLGKTTDPKTNKVTRYGFNRYYDFYTLKEHFDAWLAKKERKTDVAMPSFLQELYDCLGSNQLFVERYDTVLDSAHSDYVDGFPCVFIPSREDVRAAINVAVAGLEKATDISQDAKRRQVNDLIKNNPAPHVRDLLPDANELGGTPMFEYLFGAPDAIKI